MPTVIMCHGLEPFPNLHDGMYYWDSFDSWFAVHGYNRVVLDFPGGDNYANAQLIKSAVDALPAGEEVHLVAHSMGGLAARYAVNILGARAKTYVSLDTPQFGDLAYCAYKSLQLGAQMCPSHKFMKDVNAPVDDTPAATVFVQIRRRLDGRALLDGCWTTDVEGTHTGILSDPDVFDIVLRALQSDFSRLTWH